MCTDVRRCCEPKVAVLNRVPSEIRIIDLYVGIARLESILGGTADTQRYLTIAFRITERFSTANMYFERARIEKLLEELV